MSLTMRYTRITAYIRVYKSNIDVINKVTTDYLSENMIYFLFLSRHKNRGEIAKMNGIRRVSKLLRGTIIMTTNRTTGFGKETDYFTYANNNQFHNI